ncbi:hypothetical protein A2348_03810 [Candidatus Uhrbacteria bacterium RIFOXYB12_FULL_58_10]|uniref:ABC transporter domain-containing protein n=1 Tax=Candidatus Uhrbacteria bacterium RIFOXYB2_FULL_57_15 TaxID=1802422 RepID=A0A1F7W7B2_9BACT|nr:MAG: hypothetical protein A2348_03810 [Candidatus Uhrbacteria bacterium RIFOXYB12_FULL_58_10]OGL98077.1 MAG: hypothetical protein A2304_00960 [Candidatus Uhrbacteria bacterium RIFOXYB2_FULL_57_15]OGL99582.1 MAG: hypothetical protein A2501_00015 [Candidatus Uhrbacteria bacterium RIFOXYC12_FULL_57_11]
MGEAYRPQPHELWKKPKDLDARREVMPDSLRDSIDDAKKSVELALLEQFGISEIPPQLNAEMAHVIRAIEMRVREQHFCPEPDAAVFEQLERIAAKILTFKEGATRAEIVSRPEVGQRLVFETKDGNKHERGLTVDEQDMLFNMEMWADHLVSFQNAEEFKAACQKLRKRASTKPTAEGAAYVEREMTRTYSRFGFTTEQIKNLLALAEGNDVPALTPDGKAGATQRLRVMREVWNEYLNEGEKSSYVKFAVAMTVLGAVEGLAPAMLGKAMDSSQNAEAVAFSIGYLGLSVSTGWVRRLLDVNFDSFLNGVMDRTGGLNERLSRELAFQPGERMSMRENRGRILSAMTRSQAAFQDVLSSTARIQLPAATTALVGFGVMTAMDWRLGLLSLATAPIAIAIARKADQRTGPLVAASYQNEGEVAQEIEEQIQAHQDVVLSGMKEPMARRIGDLGKKKNQIGHERFVARSDMEFQTESALSGTVVAALTMAGMLMRNLGVENGGNIVAALMYSGQFRRGFDGILRTNNDLVKSVGAIIEMEEIFNGYAREEEALDKRRVGASELTDFSIELSGVSLEIDGDSLIRDISFRVPPGGVVRLEGRSGQGKTTLSRLMSGYYGPTRGTVKIGGEDVRNVKRTGPDSLYGHIAYLSQHPYVFDNGNLRDNLVFGNPNATDADMSRVLNELGLSRRFTKDGAMDLSSSIRGLSGGEKARLGLARVLLKIRSQKDGSIVFLDQATEELDEETEKEVAQILLDEKRQRPNTTFVIISHRSDFIRALETPSDGKEGFVIQRIKPNEE